MVSLALGLAAAATIAAAAPPPNLEPPIGGRSGCGRSIDPLFVHYVPPAPTSGPNPLFRLIGGPQPPEIGPRPPPALDCTRLLTRTPPLR